MRSAISIIILYSCLYGFEGAGKSRPRPSADSSYWPRSKQCSANGNNNKGNNFSDVCNCGRRQLPINIVPEQTAYNAELTPIRLDFEGTARIQMRNTGQTIHLVYDYENGSIPVITGGPLPGPYRTMEIHYTWGQSDGTGSEHAIDSRTYELELQMVNVKSEFFNQQTGFDGDAAVKDLESLAILSALLTIGPTVNDNWTIVTNNLKNVAYNGETFNLPPVNVNQMRTALPWDTTNYYTYPGSLTAPPCNEAVIWIVFSQIGQLSADQIQAFRDLKANRQEESADRALGDNFRPWQNVNERTVCQSFESIC